MPRNIFNVYIPKKRTNKEQLVNSVVTSLNDKISNIMDQRRILSNDFNMSWGFIPVIVSMLLYELTTQDISIYIGTVIGILGCFYIWKQKGEHVPRIILYTTTGMLGLLSITALLTDHYCPPSLFRLTLEVSTIIPLIVFLLNPQGWTNRLCLLYSRCYHPQIRQGAEATLASTKLILLLCFIHFLIISCIIFIQGSLSQLAFSILFYIFPPIIYILSILCNQLSICYFNHLMRQTHFLPIVDTQGHVIGKIVANHNNLQQNKLITPVIRIAVTYHQMLFLLPRSSNYTTDSNQQDIPLEGHLLYGETLEQGARRLVHHLFPNVSIHQLHFSLKYYYKSSHCNQLIYLFLLELTDESMLQVPLLHAGKLWTLQQITHNLNKGYFSNQLECEYKSLEAIIYTREKYKES